MSEEARRSPSHDQTTPLLSSDRLLLPHSHSNSSNSSSPSSLPLSRLRRHTSHFLTSKYGHYAVILLVAIDVSCIFADFLISLHICEHVCQNPKTPNYDANFDEKTWRAAGSSLGIVSLVISCLFMLELLLSLWSFGVLPYLKNWFHILDATVIIASFVIDVSFHGGVIEEVGSLVVVARLWRVVKIVEEFGAAGEETMEGLKGRVEELEKELEGVKKQRDNWVKGARRGFGLAKGRQVSGHGQDGSEDVDGGEIDEE